MSICEICGRIFSASRIRVIRAIRVRYNAILLVLLLAAEARDLRYGWVRTLTSVRSVDSVGGLRSLTICVDL